MVLRFWKKRKTAPDVVVANPDGGPLVELRGRTVSRQVLPVVGSSILELAEENKVDWMSSCKRGTCARCRCLVSEGMEFLSDVSDAELERLESEEIEQGFRLGCQAKVAGVGDVVVRHRPYF